MKYFDRIKLFFAVILLLSSGACVKDRSTGYLEKEVGSLEKRLEETERKLAELIAERDRLSREIADGRLQAERAAELLEEKKRLEEEIALAKLELERGGAVGVERETTGEVRRTEVAGKELAVKPAGEKAAPTELPFEPRKMKLHIVSKGESLARIAGYESYYGDQGLWPYIYLYNKHQIKNPDWIFEGQQLTVPFE